MRNKDIALQILFFDVGEFTKHGSLNCLPYGFTNFHSQIYVVTYLVSRDEFELEFSGLSEPEV